MPPSTAPGSGLVLVFKTKEAKRFTEVKKGDQVVLRITEAPVVAVAKP